MKTTEIVFDEVSFRDRRHYRLLLDNNDEPRGVVTKWSEKTDSPKFDSVQLYQFDNRKKILVVVEAMVNNKPTEVARGELIGDLWGKSEEIVCKLEIGTIRTTCSTLKQTVLEMLKMADHGESVVGVDVSCGIGGQHDTIDKTQTIFYDMKIKVRDDQDTIVASGKIGPKKSGVFLPLAPSQIKHIKSGKYDLELQIGDDEPVDIPLHAGICVTAVPAAKDPINTIILTTCVKYEPARWAGVVHSVYTFLKRAGGEKETHLKDLKKAPLDKLLRSTILHMQVVDEGASGVKEDAILESCVEFPPKKGEHSKEDTSNGDFYVNEVIHRHYKDHDFTSDATTLRKHVGSVYRNPPSDISKPLKMRIHFMDADYAKASDDKSSIAMTYKNFIGVADMTEIDRQVNEATSAITYRMSGSVDMSGYQDDMKAALQKIDTELAVEIVYTSVPSHQPPKHEIDLLPDTPEAKVEIVEKIIDNSEEIEALQKKLKKEKLARKKEHEALEHEREEREREKAEREKERLEFEAAQRNTDAYDKEHEALTLMQQRYNEEMETLKKKLSQKSELVEKDEDEIDLLKNKLKEMDRVLAGGQFELPIAENGPAGGDEVGKERPNADDEMPGVSVLEDLVHRESIDSIYNSFHEVYDEDERSLGHPGMGLSPKGMMGHKRSTKAGFALAHVIKAELVEKQKVIDRLLDEARDRSDAIDLCGAEIRKLRDDVADWKQQAQDRSQELQRHEDSISEGSRFIQQKVGSPEELSLMNRATLIHVALELGERVRTVESEGAEYKQRYMEGQAARQKYYEQTKMLQDLSEAHMQQSYFIQKLQKRVAKMDTYKSTIKLQESIIGKMQKVVEAHLKTSALDAGGGGRNDLLDRLMSEIDASEQESHVERKYAEKVENATSQARAAEESLAAARKTQTAMQNELEHLRTRCKELEDAEPAADTKESLTRIAQLEAELTASQYRVAALEESLELQAQDAGKEISRLRTRLFDFEMAAILAEDVDNPEWEDENAYVPSELAKAPSGSAVNAIEAINETKKDDEEGKEEVAAAAAPEETGENKGLSKAASAVSLPAADKIEMHITDEIKLTVPVVMGGAEKGNVDIFYKMRYSQNAPDPMEPDTPLDVVVQSVSLRDYAYSPEEHGENYRLSVDVAFDTDSFKARTSSLVANGEALLWNFYPSSVPGSKAGSNTNSKANLASNAASNVNSKVNLASNAASNVNSKAKLGSVPGSKAGSNVASRAELIATLSPEEQVRMQMQWTTKFSELSSEYLFVKVMTAGTGGASAGGDGTEDGTSAAGTGADGAPTEGEDKVVATGRTKFVHSEGAEESRVQAEKDGLEAHPDADMSPVESEHPDMSPRPVPTGRLHRNMHVLNSIIRVVGKTAAYMDEAEADESHFENPETAPAVVATVLDDITGEIVRVGEGDTGVDGNMTGDDGLRPNLLSNSSSKAGSKSGSKPGSKPGSRPSSNPGSDHGSTHGGSIGAGSKAGSTASKENIMHEGD